MPDWSYRTVFRPLLFALLPRLGRDVALDVMGGLARLPLGAQVIDFLGHMRPPEELGYAVLGRTFATPLGFGAALDPHLLAYPALARLGVGFIEIGPVSVSRTKVDQVTRHDQQHAIEFDNHYSVVTPELAIARAERWTSEVPVIVRVDADLSEAAIGLLCAHLRPAALAVEVDGLSYDEIARALSRIAPVANDCPLLLSVSLESPDDAIQAIVDAALRDVSTFAGVLLTGEQPTTNNHRMLGSPCRAASLAQVQALRTRYGREQLAIIAGAGVHEPLHALELLSAGANLVRIDTGLVFSGPGFVKLCNEALVAQQHASSPLRTEATWQSGPRYAWFWLWLMGLAMGIGGVLAVFIAATRVMLPYDEQFVGLTRSQIDAINPRLLSFMTHDRVTLAGTMLSAAILYLGLAGYGVRRGLHWAWVAVMTSALSGFFSFFSFLGFGYFEPFHAFVTVVLFQFLLMAWHAPLPPRSSIEPVPLVEDWRWRLGLWGQLGLIVEAAVILTAGIVICIVGSTSVFVAEDLAYMGMCADDVAALDPRLLSLVAHDRATFGGMLVACGLTTLLASLWGFAAGRAWLFWTLLIAGSTGYLCTLAVHFGVGYFDIAHLAPAFGGLALHWFSMGLAAPYLLRVVKK